MSSRLAGEFALLAAAALLARSVLERQSVSVAVESALWAGGGGWLAGAVASVILAKLADEHAELTTAKRTQTTD